VDNQRVAEVFVPGTSSGATGTFGSGYFIDETLVLTAGHVVDQVVAASCSGELVGEVRPLSSQSWLKARVVWRGTSCDAALLEICPVDRPRDGLNREWLGRLATYERAPFRAIGFPEAQARNEAGGRLIRDTEEIRGNFVPLTGLKTALLTLDLEGSVPNAMVAARSPWAGMSGAAVFSGSLLVGIVAEDPQNFEPDRLRVTPVTSMVEEAGFRTFIAGDADRPVLLDAVEDVALTQFVLRAPYRPLPPNAAPSFLLRSIFGVVPFRGRAAEMRSLSDWCASDASIALALIVAPGGSGKTRLAAELCRKQRDDGWVSGFLDADANRDQLRGLARVTSRLLVAVDYAETRVAQVIDLIERLARSTPSTNRIRVLLIARETGDWWPSLPSRVEGVDAELLVRAATLYELGPIEREPIARRDAFREAARHFAPIMGSPMLAW